LVLGPATGSSSIGTHHELLERGGVHAALYERRFQTGAGDEPDLALASSVANAHVPVSRCTPPAALFMPSDSVGLDPVRGIAANPTLVCSEGQLNIIAIDGGFHAR
jgi:hypothetical protein